MITAIALLSMMQSVAWQHPAGLVTNETITEIRAKLDAQPWARAAFDARKAALGPWLDADSEELRRVFPMTRGNVYHNFSCPADRRRLTFDPFHPEAFVCPLCGAQYPPETNAGIYAPKDRYYGTMYEGWACLFYETAGQVAADLALIGIIEGRDDCLRRGVEILMCYADAAERIETTQDPDPQMRRIFTYHREGDNKVLNDAACAYELLRASMTPEQRARFEQTFLTRLINDIMLEPVYRYEHNNLYQWHRTIVQAALCLEREDLIDWSLGFGDFSPEAKPEHSSIRRIAAAHFKPDGAFWEMCSGYHLYPVDAFCELAVVSHNLSKMDPARFPPEQYDLTDPGNAAGHSIDAALHWFMSMAMPDRTMPTIGDSMAPRAGMAEYFNTAEVGYRYFGLTEVGDYEALREGKRSWAGLLYGAPAIVQDASLPFTSSFLSSGWVSLRGAWNVNRVWAGVNALIPGGGHQHADRLGLTLYGNGKLLLLEKATPYNESVTRVLGTQSCMHNLVVVDKTSQKQGESLTPEETPQVALFYAGPWMQFTEIRADKLYTQTSRYRRQVAMIEDIVVDLFDVEGGATHDWMAQFGAPRPELSVPATKAAFEPGDWLTNGTERVLLARPDAAWEARWRVEDVTARLTMMGAPGTQVFSLETYPIDNATVTAINPPCQTLCVRREGVPGPFCAVWDSWKETPRLRRVAAGDVPGALLLETDSGAYYVKSGPGRAMFEGGIALETDGGFAVVRPGTGAVLVGGRTLAFESPAGRFRVSCDAEATVEILHTTDGLTHRVLNPIQYDTCRGQDIPRTAPGADATVEGTF